jgi:heme exporter protein B
MWRDAWLMAGKDLRIELRSRVAFNQVIPFAFAVVLLFGLALGPDRAVLAPAAAGLFWIAVLLSSVLTSHRSFAVESSNGARDGLRLSGLDPAGIFVGKAAALAVELLLLQCLLAIGVAVLYGARLSGAAFLLATSLAATVGLAAVGTAYGALASGLKVGETLLPLLLLPVAAPVLLGATKAFNEALAGTPSRGIGWLLLLVMFAVVYSAIGVISFGSLLEDG